MRQMRTAAKRTARAAAPAWALMLVLALAAPAAAQRRDQGHSIGTVSVRGKLIVMHLKPGALGHENLFDLQNRTLTFTPAAGGYRVTAGPLRWDANRGAKLSGPALRLADFAFPFSGRQWRELSVGFSGSIQMGSPGPARHYGAYTIPPRGGVAVPRFAQLAQAAGALVNGPPAICVFFKPRLQGDRYVSQNARRVLITWNDSSPYGGIQDFHWFPTVNQFQAGLYKDGRIVLSYRHLTARDAIVGVYPRLTGGAPRRLAVLPGSAASLKSLRLSTLDGVLLRATFQAAAPLPLPGSHRGGFAYRIRFARPGGGAQTSWVVAAFARRPAAGLRYMAFGPGVSRRVHVHGDRVSVEGVLPPALQSAPAVLVSAHVFSRRRGARAGRPRPAAAIAPRLVHLRGLRNPRVHFAALSAGAGPFPVVYEAFHYYRLPDMHNLACTVIKALGDRFDFLAYYSDFRVDNQEAGTPSNGPRGSTGPQVTGIGRPPGDPAAYCSAGRFQWAFIQPIDAGAIQMQKYPPANAPVGNRFDITHYRKQIDEVRQSDHMPPYMYAMSQIGHEMDHRWNAFLSAQVNGKIIPLGNPVHWRIGLQVPVPFPYVRPTEASIMGGGVWQDNHNGTYTQLDDNYYVPATGYSYLDLYTMGLISPAEVPNFFLLQHLKFVGRDAAGHPIFKADRLDLNIQEVIAADGPRRPGVMRSQRRFNTGMVMIEMPGHQPTARLIREVTGIRRQWIKFFSIVTGRRAHMTANP